MEVSDSTVVVTGATRGIGAAVTRLLVTEGAHVVGCARDEGALADLAAGIDGGDQSADGDGSDGDDGDDGNGGNAGGTLTTVRADVRDEYDVERLLETASRAGTSPGVDAVVACAGVSHGTPGEMPLGEESYTAFDDTLRTNVRGVFATVREALPHMDGDGRVLVPSGSVAREAAAGMGAYAVSKAAAEAVVRGFAVDAEPAVGVVDPGLVATALTGGDRGRDPGDVAPMFLWALRDLDADELNAEVVDLRTWRTATR
jgi:NAD(P)-dependent dehydrogenase (short-subunit alcohol dehydrogenase family)